MPKEQKLSWPGDTIKDFWGGEMLLSSADLIAVRNGLKKVFRAQINKEQEHSVYEEMCKKWGLKMVISDKKLLGRYNIYLSLDEKLAEEAKSVDPSFKIILEKKEFGSVVPEVKEFSRLLSYPGCCVDRYIENVTNSVRVAQSSIFKNIPPKIDFLLNGFFNGVSNHYLSFHLPCSFSCQKTLTYHKKILACAKNDSPEFYWKLTGLLKRPLLVFLNPARPNLYISWDGRQGFLFDGEAKPAGLSYKRALYLKTSYPEFTGEEGEDGALREAKKAIAGGNRIIFARSGFAVFRGAKKIFAWRDNEHLAAYFLNFV